MPKYMYVSCLFLFWAFYEMSGGADFQPPARPEMVAEVEPEVPAAPLIVITETAAPQEEILTASSADEADATLINAAISAGAENSAEVPETLTAGTIATAEPTLTEPVAEVAADPIDMRLVAADWVNMRDGPSTTYAVLDTLPNGTAAEVIEVNRRGWARVRLAETGRVGWMAERLLAEK
ncbi:SH3 domain-containing protein [Loktanella agnita]|uniref:SH3 domain-containing protein n=1 Tax=Loktanella agnita TaxID=287097 RepID=UPI003985FCA0